MRLVLNFKPVSLLKFRKDIQYLMLIFLSLQGNEGVGLRFRRGSSFYRLYRYVPRYRVWFFSRFGLK